MDGGGLGTEHDAPAGDQRAPAHVGVVVEEEELIDEATESHEVLAAHQTAGPRDDRHVARLAVLARFAVAAGRRDAGRMQRVGAGVARDAVLEQDLGADEQDLGVGVGDGRSGARGIRARRARRS